jgi:hypothetical protein
MPAWTAVLTTIGGSLLLWVVGTVVFDAVHWVLHGMLRSRWRLLRGLAWPHAVHHAWLDRTLSVHWELQGRNVWCHLVPEFLTQGAFTAGAALLVPAPIAWGCFILQAAVFVALLSYRGLDVNHRPIDYLDAYPPSFVCRPAYHALHHVYPDAYFSAYGMFVDWLVGGGLYLRGRTVTLAGTRTAFEDALCAELRARGGRIGDRIDGPLDARLAEVDVLLLCDTVTVAGPLIEALAAATRRRRLPPEAWVASIGTDATARRCYTDGRVLHRTLAMTDAAELDPAAARRAARVATFFLFRGARWVSTTVGLRAWRAYRRFRRTVPVTLAGGLATTSRAQRAAA